MSTFKKRALIFSILLLLSTLATFHLIDDGASKKEDDDNLTELNLTEVSNTPALDSSQKKIKFYHNYDDRTTGSTGR